MIRLILGNVGSGKTATMVRFMRDNPHMNFLTNIDVKGKNFRHVEKLKGSMIIKKEIKSVKKNGEEVFSYTLNTQFWRDYIKEKGQINIIIDEAHVFFSARRSMSKINQITTDFLALLRRMLGSTNQQGSLILITQLSRRLDVIAKEMATDVVHNICHYSIICDKCGYMERTNNEVPDNMNECPYCKSRKLSRQGHTIEVKRFRNIDEFSYWFAGGVKTYYSRYIIKDIHTIFGNYDTLQFDDLLSEF